MLTPPSRRILRPKTILLGALATFTVYYFLFSDPSPGSRVVPYPHENKDSGQQVTGLNGEITQSKSPWDVDPSEIRNWRDSDDEEDPNDVEPGYYGDGKQRKEGEISRLQSEKDLRKMWRYAYKMTKK